MIPTWKTEEKDKKTQKIGKNGSISGLWTPWNPLTDPKLEFSQGNNCEHMH